MAWFDLCKNCVPMSLFLNEIYHNALQVYKKELHNHVESCLGSNLRARLSTALALNMEASQKEMAGNSIIHHSEFIAAIFRSPINWFVEWLKLKLSISDRSMCIVFH